MKNDNNNQWIKTTLSWIGIFAAVCINRLLMDIFPIIFWIELLLFIAIIYTFVSSR